MDTRHDQRSNAPRYHCWSSGIPGVIQPLVRAVMPTFAPHAAFCPPCVTIPSGNSKQPVRQQAQPRWTGPKGISSPVNQGLAPRDHQDCLPRSVSQNGRICHFRHHDPTWQPRGTMMLGT